MKKLDYKSNYGAAVLQALLAALLFGLNSPFSKLLLANIPPMYMASFLYLGAALGMSAIWLLPKKNTERKEAGMSRKDTLWVVLMILLDTAAPFLLLSGLRLTTATTVSLLCNFEMVATAVVARALFKESVGKRMWLSIGIITLASLVLSLDIKSLNSISFSLGSLLVLCACLCWGLENNCTRNLSAKNPALIVMIKGFGSGLIALFIALATEKMSSFYPLQTALALVLGFISYGLSIFLYIKAQRWLGAARTGMYYAAAPFFGVIVSLLVLGEKPGMLCGAGAVLMVAGVVVAVYEKHSHSHVHTKIVHEHMHNHLDGHHMHEHDPEVSPETEHCHIHVHTYMVHSHEHKPDIHHRHIHG